MLVSSEVCKFQGVVEWEGSKGSVSYSEIEPCFGVSFEG